MGTLHAFLHPETPENQKVFISKRFKDEKGNVIPFIIRAVTQSEAAALRKKATKTYRSRTGELITDFNADAFSAGLIIAGTVQPDFQATDLCEAYGVLTGDQVIGKMLLAGEYQALSDAIAKLSGMDNNDLREEAKN